MYYLVCRHGITNTQIERSETFQKLYVSKKGHSNCQTLYQRNLNYPKNFCQKMSWTPCLPTIKSLLVPVSAIFSRHFFGQFYLVTFGYYSRVGYYSRASTDRDITVYIPKCNITLQRNIISGVFKVLIYQVEYKRQLPGSLC